MARSGSQAGLGLWVRVGITIVLVLVGAVVLALTAGPVAAPAEPLAMSRASLAPGAAEAATRSGQVAVLVDPLGAASFDPEGASGAELSSSTVAMDTPEQPATTTVAAGDLAVMATSAPGAPVAAATVREEPTAPLPGSTPVVPVEASPAAAPSTAALPTVAAGVTPTLGASVTPGPTPSVPTASATPMASPVSFEDLADLESFLLMQRSSIGGQSFGVLSLTADTSNAALPYFVLAVEGSETADMFVAQTAADTLDYGRLLLGDIVRYLGGGHCTVAVNSIYQAASADACAAATPWCQVGPYDDSSGTWTVDWIYVRASYENGVAAIEAWNSIPQ